LPYFGWGYPYWYPPPYYAYPPPYGYGYRSGPSYSDRQEHVYESHPAAPDYGK
jgi:hypothetical protein